MKRPALCDRLTVLFLLPVIWTVMGLAGCAGKDEGSGYDMIVFDKVAEFSDSRGQAKIKLYTYDGQKVEEKNIRAYAETLGCGMSYAYFYPVSLQTGAIPIAEINAARSFKQAEEILYQGEGYGRWHFSSQCLGLIPIVSDCRQSSLSMQCR
jgi:hypothetical protein